MKYILGALYFVGIVALVLAAGYLALWYYFPVFS